MTETFTCPVCGYPGLDERPRSSTPGNGSHETCYSCGFEFGYTDGALGYTDEAWRQKWIDLGMPWDSDGIEDPPEGWDPAKQLADLLNGETTNHRYDDPR